MSIQSSINSMIGSASRAVWTVKGYKALKQKGAEQPIKPVEQQVTRQEAMQKMAEKGQDQVDQKQQFNDYIGNLETNFGGKVSDLPEAMQKQIYKQLGKENK